MTSDEETTGVGYYAGSETRGSAARASGWRRRIGQYVRFEMALAPWDGADVDSVLDLGCGTGELARYLTASGRVREYVGVDRRPRVLARARRRHDGETFLEGDLFEIPVDRNFDLVVAVGAQVDGRAPAEEVGRVERVERLVGRCRALARRGLSCVILDQKAVRENFALRAEPALFGVTRDELAEVLEVPNLPGNVRSDVLPTDLLAAVAISGHPPGAMERERVVQRAIEVHRRRGGSRLDEAWIWMEIDAWKRAREVLEDLEETGARYRHLADRAAREM